MTCRDQPGSVLKLPNSSEVFACLGLGFVYLLTSTRQGLMGFDYKHIVDLWLLMQDPLKKKGSRSLLSAPGKEESTIPTQLLQVSCPDE